MSLIKPPRLTAAAVEKLTEEEQRELQDLVTAEMLTNITAFFKKTPIITLPGKLGYYETVEKYLKENHPNYHG